MNQIKEQSAQWSIEDNLIEFSQQTLSEFWQTRNEGFIEGQAQKKLYWVSFTKPEHTKAIMIVNGRSESVLKYQELFWDLFQQGFDIYSFDHRGQGLSERCYSNKQLGHVEEFDFYIKDLKKVIGSFNLDRYQNQYLLAHSMGCAISTLYLQANPQHGFERVAFSAPMFGIKMPWYLQPISGPVTKWASTRTPTPDFAFGQKPYRLKPFEDNQLTNSSIRYQFSTDLYEKMSDIQLGGPSSHWVNQSLVATKRCIQQAQQINVPILVMQASQDMIVENRAQTRFITQLNKKQPPLGKLVVIEGAKHELFCEVDALRNQALDQILMFFHS